MVFGIIPECRSASRRNGCSPSSESPKSSAHRLRVRQFTVPELLLALGWEGIDVLKIDIEGYEKTLFHGNNAWLSRVRMDHRRSPRTCELQHRRRSSGSSAVRLQSQVKKF